MRNEQDDIESELAERDTYSLIVHGGISICSCVTTWKTDDEQTELHYSSKEELPSLYHEEEQLSPTENQCTSTPPLSHTQQSSRRYSVEEDAKNRVVKIDCAERTPRADNTFFC
jgi:hypothetical protein